MLSLEEILPPELLPFESVRGDVIDAWEAAQTEAALAAQAEDYATRLRDGARNGRSATFRLETEMGMGRNAFLDDAPAGMVEGVFQMTPGDIRVFAVEGWRGLARAAGRCKGTRPNKPEAQLLMAQFSQQAIAGHGG